MARRIATLAASASAGVETTTPPSLDALAVEVEIAEAGVEATAPPALELASPLGVGSLISLNLRSRGAGDEVGAEAVAPPSLNSGDPLGNSDL